MRRLQRRVAALTGDMHARLNALTHRDGSALIRAYGPRDMAGRGGALAFNVLDPDGRALPYSRVEAAARDAGIAIRGGCFCNPGAAEAAFGIDGTRLADCLRQLGDTFTVPRLAACSGGAAGALRASPGLASNAADIDRLVALLQRFAG